MQAIIERTQLCPLYYYYDANGNSKKDGLNGLEFDYNFLNLMSRVRVGSSVKANYAWSSDGMKLTARSTVTNGIGYEYLGSLIYKYVGSQLQLESGSFGGGRIVSSMSTSPVYTPNYFITDHLGSVRVVWDGSSAKRSDYYPFGGRWTSSGTQAGVSRFQYNGKEVQNELANGLNYLDYGARMYDHRIGRWHSVDPLAEVRPWESAFSFCGNNPLNRIDPTGMIWEDPEEAEKLRQEVEKRIAQLEKQNARLTERRNKKEGKGNTRASERLSNKIANNGISIDYLSHISNGITEMGNNEDYTFAFEAVTGVTSNYVKKRDDGTIVIEFSSMGLKLHETSHAYDYMKYPEYFKWGNDNHLGVQPTGAGMIMFADTEERAHRVQYSYNRNMQRSSLGVPTSILDVTYQWVGGIDKNYQMFVPYMNDYRNALLKQRMNVSPKPYFKYRLNRFK